MDVLKLQTNKLYLIVSAYIPRFSLDFCDNSISF